MDATLTFAHLSDLHFTSLADASGRDLMGKRALGYLSWRWRRSARHRAEILAAALRDLELTRPDHIVLTGDLTNLGLPVEIAEAWQWLESLGPPSRLTVVPGNHDAYAATTVEAMVERWMPYLASDTPPIPASTADGAVFPAIRVRGPAAFIGLNSARPSAPFLAVGSLGPYQLERLAEALVETGRRGLFRVVLLHHPVLPGTVGWRKRLTDHAALRGVLARNGADLVLHGHTHRASLGYLDASPRTIPVVGVPSASAADPDLARSARYHLYRLTRRPGGWELALSGHGYSTAHERFVADGEPRSLLGPIGQ